MDRKPKGWGAALVLLLALGGGLPAPAGADAVAPKIISLFLGKPAKGLVALFAEFCQLGLTEKDLEFAGGLHIDLPWPQGWYGEEAILKGLEALKVRDDHKEMKDELVAMIKRDVPSYLTQRERLAFIDELNALGRDFKDILHHYDDDLRRLLDDISRATKGKADA